jgi:hypothetical protein
VCEAVGKRLEALLMGRRWCLKCVTVVCAPLLSAQGIWADMGADHVYMPPQLLG